MQASVITFLTCFILLEYLTYNGKGFMYYTSVKYKLPKPFSCQTCLTFWAVLFVSLYSQNVITSILYAQLSFITYILLKRIL